MKAERNKVNSRKAKRRLRMFALLGCLFVLASIVQATPKQDDVFKSIQDSMSTPAGSESQPTLWLLCGGGVIVLLVFIGSRRQQKATRPEPLNNPGKLLKEVLREVPLKSGEVKQLKLLAELVEDGEGEPANPITLLLCPSLMAKGLKEGGARVDRKAVAQIVRKLRVGQMSPNT